MNNNFIVNASVVIFDKQGKILLGHRSPDEDVYPNFWGIPGGKIDNEDKTLESGLRREVMEEVGVKIKNIELVSNDIQPKNNDVYVIYLRYKAEILSGTPKPLEDTSEVRWFEFREIDSTKLTPFTYETIKKAIEG